MQYDVCTEALTFAELNNMSCNKQPCALCEMSDSAAPAMAYMEKLETALLTKNKCAVYSTMAKCWNRFIAQPLKMRDLQCPELTKEQCEEHFTQHVYSSKRMLLDELTRVNQLQEHLTCFVKDDDGIKTNEANAKHYANLISTKVDIIKQLGRLSDGGADTIPQPPDMHVLLDE